MLLLATWPNEIKSLATNLLRAEVNLFGTCDCGFWYEYYNNDATGSRTLDSPLINSADIRFVTGSC